MKEMPERIYLFDCNDAMTTPLDGDTEYIRKDSFIEKAYEWLKNNAERYVYWMDEEFGNKDLLEDFKKYMEEQV